VNPDGADAEVELSGKLGASVAASSKLSFYGELSGVTGDVANSYGVKAGAKYAF
jgi:predicted aconitase with swiveling domain